jgi:hypothetical protein
VHRSNSAAEDVRRAKLGTMAPCRSHSCFPKGNSLLAEQATQAFVEELSEKAAAHLLDLILKKRASSSEGDDSIFETGETRIRLEDYEKLDANGDGLISR